MTWSRRFEDPIRLPDGTELQTLREAGNYIASLPRAEHESERWQAAIEALIMAAQDRGPLLHARVGMLQALHHGRPAPLRPPQRKPAKAYRIVR